ncbi:MAG TPA: hypothetical protein VHO24_12470 [Opitutaceae bacterium]|nr:hypothetical protein [Opitutaceae bacterium]
MKSPLIAALALALTAALPLSAAESPANPADNLPPHIKRLTWFGERADWSHDGQRILFLEKTFGDVFEIEVATGRIRGLTHHFPHHGFTRALYLSNGDILLSGPETFDPSRPGDARTHCFLSVLDRRLNRPPVSLGTKCSEGPAVSRHRLHIAWTHVAAQYPERLPARSSQILEADIVYDGDTPKLSNQRLALDSRDLPFQCTLECQNFGLPGEKELTFSAYEYQGTDVFSVDLATKKITNHSNAPGQYDEPEGIFPDGQSTLVESDHQNHQGSRHVDLWQLKLDGSGTMKRLTFFSDIAGYKASNGVVSDDGRWLAFQLAKSVDAAGVGYGIFVLDLQATR